MKIRIKGLKVEKRITPEGIELKFNYKLEKNIFTSIDFDDIFKKEQEVSEVDKKILKRFEINCPFCEGNSVSDIIDSIEDVDGQWECSNGHQFVLKYIRKMEKK